MKEDDTTLTMPVEHESEQVLLEAVVERYEELEILI